MISESVERSHVLKVIEALNHGQKIPSRREAKKYDLVFDGHRYPPKYVLKLAYDLANPGAKPLVGFRGGRRVNRFLENLGFKVHPRGDVKNDVPKSPANPPLKTRQFWVVSQNVTQKRVEEWVQTILSNNVAIMGWGPADNEHLMGPKFAKKISNGDVILIARSHNKKPEVVGFGIVSGGAKTSGLSVPDKSWHGSFRRLSPFVRHRGKLPDSIMNSLNHRSALRELHPRSEMHKQVCDWMISRLNGGDSHGGRRTNSAHSRPKEARLGSLPHDHQFEFETRTKDMVRYARKAEAVLVREFEEWLRRAQRKLCIANYRGLRCDAYEEERQNLLEAKSLAKREHIRMAVGQLLDYAYLGKKDLGQPNLAILTPTKPDKRIIAWLSTLKISVVWKQKGKFVDNANGQFC
jgi:hypothetical protein